MQNRFRLKQYGLTPSTYRILWFRTQGARCHLCSDNFPFDENKICYDPVTNHIYCRKCKFALNALRKIDIKLVERLIELARIK